MNSDTPRAHKILATNIRSARSKLEYSQQQLAERADLSTSYVNDIEQGKKWPSADSLERISTALGLEPFMLLLPPGHSGEYDAFDLLTDYAMSVKESLAGAMDDSLKKILGKAQRRSSDSLDSSDSPQSPDEDAENESDEENDGTGPD
jgi:transcriptional regulator with XRE-family HTH domain